MASNINLKVTSNFDAASRDLKQFGATTEAQRAKIEKFAESFKTENIDRFMDRNRRNAAAIKATQGPVAALETEYKGLQREIQRLIRNGLDPQDDALKPLVQRYKQLDTEMGQAQAQAKKTGKTLGQQTVSDMMKIAAGVGAAVAAFRRLGAFFNESIQLWGQQEQAEAKLASAIEVTGENAVELLPKYKAIASEIQGITTVGDETTLVLMQTAQSMGITSDRMEEATKGAIGLSKAFGIGTERALRGVANAFEGNFTTLQRYIPAIRSATTDAEKMRIVQEGMAQGFEVATAEAETGTGAMAQYGNAMGDLKEQIGAVIVDAAEPFVRTLTDYASRAAAAIEKTREFKDVMDALEAGMDMSDKSVGQLEDASARLEEKLADLNKSFGQYGMTLEEAREEEKRLMEVSKSWTSASAASDAAALTRIRTQIKAIETTQEEIAQLEALIRAKKDEAQAAALQAKWMDETSEERKRQQELEMEAARISQEYNEAISERVQLQQDLGARLDDIEKKRRQGFITEEEANEQRKTAYSEAQAAALALVTEFDTLADAAEAAGAQGAKGLEGITAVAGGDRISRFIIDLNEALAEFEVTADQATEPIRENMSLLDTGLVPLTEEAAEMYRRLGEAAIEAGEETEDLTESMVDTFEEAVSQIGSLLDSIGSLVSAVSEREIAEIERTYDARVDAIEGEMEHIETLREARQAAYEDLESQYAGMADIYEMLGDAETAATYEKLADQQGLIEDFTQFTAEQRAQMLEDAKAAGNEEVAAAIEAANQRVAAEEQAAAELEQLEKEKAAAEKQREREIAQAEYRSAMAQWGFNLATAIAETAVSVAKSIAGSPLTFGLPWSAANAAAGAVEIAAVAAAKPEPPSFQTGTGPSGFVVPESTSTRGDSQLFRANPGERVDVTPRGGAAVSQRFTVMLGEEKLIEWVNDKIDSGEIRIGANV